MISQPLTDAEFERLSGIFGRFDNKHTMTSNSWMASWLL